MFHVKHPNPPPKITKLPPGYADGYIKVSWIKGFDWCMGIGGMNTIYNKGKK